MNFFDLPLESHEPTQITFDISRSENLSDLSSLPIIKDHKHNESRLKRNEREKKRQQKLQKLMKRLEEQVNANKPSSEHVFSQRLILDRAIEMIITLEKKRDQQKKK